MGSALIDGSLWKDWQQMMEWGVFIFIHHCSLKKSKTCSIQQNSISATNNIEQTLAITSQLSPAFAGRRFVCKQTIFFCQLFLSVFLMDFDNLQDVLLKCRCCFRILTNEAEAVKISESIESSFFELTQIEVSL